MKRSFRAVIYPVLFSMLLMISGCWDSKEVEELAIITLITCDRVTENGVDQWQVSTKILNMSGKESGSESGQKTSGSEIHIKGTGLTFEEAILDITKRLPKKIFYQQNAALVLGERAAKEELANLIGNVLRFPGTRLRTSILICRGEAFQTLQTEPEIGTVLSKEVKILAEKTAERTGASTEVTLLDFSKRLSRTDRDPVLPEIKAFIAQEGEKTASPTVVLEGLGVIRNSELVGWLNPEETLGYLLLTEKSTNAQIPISSTYGDTLFSYFLSSFKSKIESELVEGKPRFTIKIKTEGVIHELATPILGFEELPGLEKAASERIQEIALQTIAKAKEYDSDFLGLNEHLHRYHPSEWEEIAPNWRERFQDADIEVEVEAKIRNFGTSTRKFDFPQ